MAEKKDTKEEKKAPAKKPTVKAPAKEEKPKAPVKKTAAEPTKETKSKSEGKKDSTVKEDKSKAPKKGEEKEEKNIIKESLHTIPLRKAFDKPRTKRAQAAVAVIRAYISKHTRKEPAVDPKLNELLWNNGIENIPRRVKVKIQEEETKATATLP